ncbi:hypothetical protein [Hyalangium sp.]|uniref:hypothetical protein n=1 Tax=Hyalangium sp. TaxID=2028555 RepID=UPI002D74778A|nr:hypothetical protein [Hyalangium sp.]HYI00882.1 hypothetical protein [Hyalangium sp.]
MSNAQDRIQTPAAGSLAARGRFIIMGDSDDSYDFSELMGFGEGGSRARRVRVRQVWRQAPGAGVSDGSQWVRAILEHLGLPSQPGWLAPARGPPQNSWV